MRFRLHPHLGLSLVVPFIGFHQGHAWAPSLPTSIPFHAENKGI